MKKFLIVTLSLIFMPCLSVYAKNAYFVIETQGQSEVRAAIWRGIERGEIKPELGYVNNEDWNVSIGNGVVTAWYTHTGVLNGCIVGNTKVTINGREFTYTDCGSEDGNATAKYVINIDDIKPEFTANPDWEYWYIPESSTLKARQKVAKDTLGHNSLITIYSGADYVIETQGQSEVRAAIWRGIERGDIKPELGYVNNEDWNVSIGNGVVTAWYTHTGVLNGCIVGNTKVTINGREFTYTDCGSEDGNATAKYVINIDDIKPEFTANPDWEYWYIPESSTLKARQKVAKDTLGHNSLILLYSTEDSNEVQGGGNINNEQVISEGNEQHSNNNSEYQVGNQSNISNGYSMEMNNAYNYAYQNGITTMTSIDRANMGGNLTRIAMAKMLSNYAINVLGLTPDTSKSCYFYDVSSSLDYQYDNGVTKACQLGLMGVGIDEFYPNSKVTRAEFGTVLSRALNARDTTRLNQMNNAKPYYYEHLRYLQREGIMNDISNPSSLERRGRVMLMLMRSDKNYVPEEIEYPTTYSANKIDTRMRGIYTEGCNWTTSTMNQYNTYHDMPNNNWINDAKFVNKALQDVRNNGESLVINYITEANRVLNSAGLTKKDQCRYSLLIDELENQLGSIKSYKNENGKVTIGIDFLSYKENITWDDFRAEGGGNWDLVKNTSEKVRYYTLSNNVNLQTFNIDEDGFVHKNNQGNYCAYTSNWNARLNSFCNGEPVYNGVKYPSEGSSYEPERAGQYYNRNEWGFYCVKDHIDMQLETFRFDSEGNIDQINTNYCGGFTESPFVS